MPAVEQDEFRKMTEQYRDAGGLADIERKIALQLLKLCKSGKEEKLKILNNGQVWLMLYSVSRRNGVKVLSYTA